jgi:hypothetical protein
MLVADFIEHGLENVLVLHEGFGVVIAEVEPDLCPETDGCWRLGRDESEPIQLFGQLEILAHQVQYQPLVDRVALLGSWYLEHQTTAVLVLWVLPTRLDSLLEKFNRVYATSPVVHDITKLTDERYVYILPPSLPK